MQASQIGSQRLRSTQSRALVALLEQPPQSQVGFSLVLIFDKSFNDISFLVTI